MQCQQRAWLACSSRPHADCFQGCQHCWWKQGPLCEIKRWEGVKEKVAYAFRNFDQSASKHIDITKLALNNDRHVLTGFKRPVCPQTDAVRLLLNRAMKHLYLFVVDTGVAVLCKYEVGETLWSKVTVLTHFCSIFGYFHIIFAFIVNLSWIIWALWSALFSLIFTLPMTPLLHICPLFLHLFSSRLFLIFIFISLICAFIVAYSHLLLHHFWLHTQFPLEFHFVFIVTYLSPYLRIFGLTFPPLWYLSFAYFAFIISLFWLSISFADFWLRTVNISVGRRWWDPILPIHITNHVRHFATLLRRFGTIRAQGRQGTTCFVTICDVLYHSTILYSAPFHFCDLF